MKACVYNPNKKDEACLELTNIPMPQASKSSILVKTKGVGVCGSDLLKLDRALVKSGIVLGHELVGEIFEISDELSKKYGFKKGDRIVSSHHVPCLECKFCLNKQESLCSKFKSTNFKPGAFCEYLELSEDHLKYTVQQVPDELNDLDASFTEPLACCIKAIERSGVKNYQGKNAKVLVLGLGSIGLMIGQLVKYYKPEFELNGCDLMNDRLKLAQKLGFDITVDNLQEEYFDFIFLCAGADQSIDLAIKHASNGATLVVFSSVKTDHLAFSNNEIYYKELTVLGSYSPNLNNLKEALELIANRKILVSDLISHKTNLDNLGKTIHQAKQERGIKVFLEN
jgi:L-iditol 2-dehydrogenase